MTAKNKVPEIRFKGFDGEWEDSIFNKTFTNIPNNTLSRAELNYNFGLAKNVHYGDVLIKFGELLDIQKNEIPYISNNDYANKLKSSKLKNGDIIIADAAEDEIVGKCTEVTNIEKETVLSGLHTIAVRPTQSFASKYLGYYMNSPLYHNQLLPLLQGTKVLSISKSAIKNTIIYYPVDSLEQTKIGNYFQNLDKLIEQKEKKQQKLKQFKKAMLDKMFPKNGANTPEVRFKGFSGEWAEKSFKEISKINQGLQIAISERYTNKVENSFFYITNEFLKDNCDVKYFIKNPTENVLCDEDDILMTRTGNTGEVVTNICGAFHNNFFKINFDRSKLAKNYLVYFLKLNKTQNKILTLAGNSTIPDLNHNDFYSLRIVYPDKEEQTKIGNYFQKLDKQIDLQQKELEKLKNIKTASLDKMFV